MSEYQQFVDDALAQMAKHIGLDQMNDRALVLELCKRLELVRSEHPSTGAAMFYESPEEIHFGIGGGQCGYCSFEFDGDKLTGHRVCDCD